MGEESYNNQPEKINYLLPEQLEEHEYCNKIPEMTKEEWQDFFKSVEEENRITVPILALTDGRVIDGRHRLRAAKELDLKMLPTILYDIPEDEALKLMKDSAIKKRQLSKSQCAAIELKFNTEIDKLREEAKERQGTRTDLVADLPQSQTKTKTRQKLAENAGVGERSMGYLMAVQRDAPDLFEGVLAGGKTINKAYKEKKERENKKEDKQEEGSENKNNHENKEAIEKIKKKLSETDLPKKREDEPVDSPNNRGILTREKLSDAVMYITTIFKSVDKMDKEIKKYYLEELKSAVEASLITLSQHEDEEEDREIFKVCLGVLDSINNNKEVD